jgi:hypothetical protein
MTEQIKAEGSFNLAGRKIMLCLPTYDFKVTAKLAISLASFCVQAQQHGIDIQICNISGCSVVSRVRNLIASDFLSSDCTDLMFIDSDINFDAEDIFRLMAWNIDPKKGIVAGIPVARKKGKVYISTLDTDDNEHIFMDKMVLVRAKRVATAFMMIRRDVFTQLKDAHPEWVYYDEKKVGDEMIAFFDFALKDGNYIGEDFLFCDRARELGFEVWIDPTIKLGHMGVEEFSGAFGEDARRFAQAQP